MEAEINFIVQIEEIIGGIVAEKTLSSTSANLIASTSASVEFSEELISSNNLKTSKKSQLYCLLYIMQPCNPA